MFSSNEFKKKVKAWLDANPELTTEDLEDYCQSLIPMHLFPSYAWLVDQTLSWHKHTRQHKVYLTTANLDEEED